MAETLETLSSLLPQDEETLQPVVKSCDLPPALRTRAIDLIVESSSKFTIEREMAMFVKKTFDEEFGPKWHCVAGRHFASHVSYEPNHYIYVQHGRRVFLLFKSGGGVESH